MQNPPDVVPAQPLLVLVEYLDRSWDRYRLELERTRREFANEYVHDLRVSIRRLVAALEMGRAVVRQKGLKNLRRLLKAQLDAFDALRDTQVQLTIVEDLQEELPEIVPYRDHLRKREQRLMSRLAKQIRGFHSAGLAAEVARLRKTLLNQPAPQTESAIWAAVDEAYSTVIQRQLVVRADEPASIHRLRLAFKKFRYLVESISPLLPNPPDDFLRRLHDYQTVMGDIQDVEVALQMLADFTAKNGTELPAVRTRLNEMRHANVLSFMDDMQEVRRFWRSTPDKKYPWQLKKRATSYQAKGTS